MGNLFSRSVNDLDKGNKRLLEPEEINGDYKRVRLESTVTEENVGIIAYVNPNLPGFHSILKYRY